MESTLIGNGKFSGGSGAFNSTMMRSIKARGQLNSARRYGNSSLMSKTNNVFVNKKSSFTASRGIEAVDQFSNETHPYLKQSIPGETMGE